MVVLGLLLTGLCVNPVLAWSFDRDSLAQPVASVKKLNGDELLRIGEIHDVQNHFPEALTYYEQALDSFRTRKQRRGEAVTLTRIGSIFERQGRREAAAVRLKSAVILYSKNPNQPGYGDALLSLGRITAWLGNRDEAGRLFEHASHRYTQLNNFPGMDQADIQLGLLRTSEGRTEEGDRLLQKAVENAQSRHDDSHTLQAFLALGDARWMTDQPEAARMYYQQALVLAEKGLHTRLEADLLRRLTGVYEVLEQPEQGIESGKRAITLHQALRDIEGEATLWVLLASLYQMTGKEGDRDQAMQRALLIYRHQQLTVHAGS